MCHFYRTYSQAQMIQLFLELQIKPYCDYKDGIEMDLFIHAIKTKCSIKYLLHIRLFKVEDEVYKDDHVGN